MDFKDKRFGGRDSDKDRTVPPDENYYANSGFDLNNYRPKGFYGKEENQYTSQNNYNFGNRNEEPYQNRELSPSEEFLKISTLLFQMKAEITEISIIII